MELMRRLLLVLGLLGGVWAYVDTRPMLVSVSVQDFARDKERAEQRPTGFRYRDKTLEEFYVSRSEGRRTRVDGEPWRPFHEAVRAATMEDRGEEELRSRRGLDYYAERLYFLPDEPPIGELASSLSERQPLLYVSIDGEGPAAKALTLVRVEGADAAGNAPDRLLHPRRRWAFWLLLAGLACYVLLPRPAQDSEAAGYASPSAVVLPDLLGAGLLAFFFGLPLLIASSNGASLFDFSEGWWVIGAVFGFLSLAPLIILFISTRNAAFRMRATADALELTRWCGRVSIPYDDLDSIDAVEWRTPTWLKALARIMMLFTWRGGLPAMMLEQGRGDGLNLVRHEGASERIWLASLQGWVPIIEGLEGRGIQVSEEVRELLRQYRAPAR